MIEETMSEGKTPRMLAKPVTRREVVTRGAVALGAMAAAANALAHAQEHMAEARSTGAEGLLTYLHQEIEIQASPRRVYDALLDSKQFATFTGAPAEISHEAGGAFSMFGSLIVGRNIELVPNQRIVQAWRPVSWDPGIYSVVKFEFREKGSGTKIVLDHTGFPEGDFRHLNSGWTIRYWEPLKKFLA
jgi:activator of HSP90 ATPase